MMCISLRNGMIQSKRAEEVKIVKRILNNLNVLNELFNINQFHIKDQR
jgi:hypothetical protein